MSELERAPYHEHRQLDETVDLVRRLVVAARIIPDEPVEVHGTSLDLATEFAQLLSTSSATRDVLAAAIAVASKAARD